MSRYQPELDLVLRTAVWQCSTGQKLASFGQQLLFTCYDRQQLNQYKLVLHYISEVFLKYLKDNVDLRATNHDKLQRVILWSENILVVLTLLNFFRFLKTGKRPGLVDYVLGLDHISMHGNKRREIGYSTMTRELIWGGFMVKIYL